MKIAIISDSHDNYENLNKAIEIANEKNCDILLFAGDLIAPGFGSEALSKFKGKVYFVFGNNDGDLLNISKRFAQYDNLEIAGNTFEKEIDGVRIFMNHYPRASEIAAHSGLFDLSIYGHDHQYENKMVGDCILLNPGALMPYKIEYASFVIFNTEDKNIEKIVIS